MIKCVSTQIYSYFLALNEICISIIIYLLIQLRLILIIRNDQSICQIEHGPNLVRLSMVQTWSDHGQTPTQ